MRRFAVMLVVMALGLALGSGAALSAPAPSPDAQEDSGSQVEGNIEPRIIGGTPVPDGKYRYIAAVRFKANPQRAYCGGTLIDRDSVLTAAHCAQGESASSFRVFLGRADMSSNKGVVRDVKRVFVHPDYRPATTLHDAAVLKLSRPVDNIPKLKLAPVTSRNRLEKPGSSAVIAGWGNTIAQPFLKPSCGSANNQVNYPERMREARVPIASDRYMAYTYNEYLPSFGYQCAFYEPFDMVGAGYRGKTTCQGDSGGPLIKKVWRNGKRVHYQIGITSWGAGCGQEGYPMAYAEVNSKHIAPFIKSAARN